MKPELSFQIDETYPLPIHAQLQEQIKWLIGSGVLAPGDYLPPTNQLANELNLNRNTINRVYSQLRDEGLVTLQKGRGTRVTDSEQTERLIVSRGELDALLRKFCEESEALGYDLKDLLVPAYAYAQLFRDQSIAPTPRIRLIARKEDDYPFYQSEIKRLTETDAEVLFLEDLRADATLVDAVKQTTDIIISTWRNKEELNLIFEDIDLVVIDAVADMSMLIDISQVGLGSKVAFISSTKQGAEWMARQVENAGINHIEMLTQGMDCLNELLYTVEQVDRIYVASTIYHQIKKIAAEKSYVFSLRLEQSSQKALTEIKGKFQND